MSDDYEPYPGEDEDEPLPEFDLEKELHELKIAMSATHDILRGLVRKLSLTSDDIIDAAGLNEFEVEFLCAEIRKILRD